MVSCQESDYNCFSSQWKRLLSLSVTLWEDISQKPHTEYIQSYQNQGLAQHFSTIIRTLTSGSPISIPHICHFFYIGRIFKSHFFTPQNYEKRPKITTNSPKKCRICSFSLSIWNFFHRTEFVYTGIPCGASNKYEVLMLVLLDNTITGDIRTSDTFNESEKHQNVQTWIAEWESPLLSQISNRQEQHFLNFKITS